MQTYKTLHSLLLVAALGFLTLVPAQAQLGGPKVATVTAVSKPAVVSRGGRGLLLVTVIVEPKYHINAHVPNDPAYIPTAFSGQAAPGVTFGAAKYPAAQLVKVSYSPKPLLVYRGKATIAVPFTVAKTAKPGRIALAGAVVFQGCDAKSCYPPASAPVRAIATIK